LLKNLFFSRCPRLHRSALVESYLCHWCSPPFKR
jgi:hypothetical protein